ncbi:unnamed protein product [Cuscuta europaea]|uniref:Transposase (putative) gypsy type domain-containing protein n=1 Tax=Cuscuta europaea TaxID=41803 RepID=A0A9P0ZWL8_CUSEU|nr:unnamed protein product [Cuscuta europaea]
MTVGGGVGGGVHVACSRRLFCRTHTLGGIGPPIPPPPLMIEYLRFVKLAPCQLTPNSCSYLAGFLSLCQSRDVEPTLDQFFLSFNLCRGGHSNVGGFANLQQLPEFRLFDDVPSSHKGWKEKFCYVRMAENPFPAPLRDSFRRHLKAGSAALEKKRMKLSKKSEGSEKHVLIKVATLPDELYDLGFRRYRLMGEKDERYPLSIGSTKAPEVVALSRAVISYLEKKNASCCSNILTLLYFLCFSGLDMDSNNLARLKRQLAKEDKKKEAPA